MRRLYYLWLVIVCMACSQDFEKEKNSDEINESFQFALRENIDYLGEVEDVTFVSDSLIAIISKNPSRFYLYNLKGDQIKMVRSAIDDKTRFTHPSLIKCFNSVIYIWCADQHKFFVYDASGEFLYSIKGPSYAIGDFIINKNRAFCYIDGGFSHWVSLFDLEDEMIISDLGKTSNEQLLLDRNPSSGGMILFGNEVLLSPSDQLSIFSVDDNMTLVKRKEIRDDNFKVDSVLTDPYEMVNSNIRELLDYLQENSYVNGLFTKGDSLILKAETGLIQTDESNILNNSNRFENYYLFNEDFELLKSYKVPHNFYVGGLLFSNSNALFRLRMAEGKDNFIYKLYKMEFN